MKKLRLAILFLMSLALVLPAAAKTYKYDYSNPCNQLWDAVKNTLGNTDNYASVKSDDSTMKAEYQPKHSAHFDVSGVVLQRMNHVALVPKGAGCEMEVVSNYSGWGHEDQGDFKKRVDESLVKPKAPAPTATPKLEAPSR